jgi:mono/diheme cytochrome c family protein
VLILLLALLQEPSFDTLRPGLAAELRAGDAVVRRVDPKPALAWGLDHPHPRLPPGPYAVTWTGWLQVLEPDTLRFEIQGQGAIEIDGAAPAGPLPLKAGLHRFKAEFRSKPGVPARFQLWWAGTLFAKEPVHPARFYHQPDPRYTLEEAGRRKVADCRRCHEKGVPTASSYAADWTFDHADVPRAARPSGGDARMGRREFLTVGCVACHLIPDEEDQEPLGRRPFRPLKGRVDLAEYLQGRHAPNQRLAQVQAKNLAAYLAQFDVPAPKRAGDCKRCHERPIPMKGPACAGGGVIDDAVRAWLEVEPLEKHPSPIEDRRRMLDTLGCARCHVRDGERTSPLEEASSVLGGAFLQHVPFMRAPRLTFAHQKFSADYLKAAVRDGVQGHRHGRYTFRMPAFGAKADEILKALAEADGDVVGPDLPPPADPTLAARGPQLVGFTGFACVSCHVFKGKMIAESDPGAIGPEITTLAQRLRRDWFDRWIEDPARIHPGTPMPKLAAEALRERDAFWAYFLLGPDAPSPKPPPALPIDGPLVAQIPVGKAESIVGLWDGDAVLFDVPSGKVTSAYVGARLLRHARGRIRTYELTGTPVPLTSETVGDFLSYERLEKGFKVKGSRGELVVSMAERRPLGVPLPPARKPEDVEVVKLGDPGPKEGALERPGYRAVAWPRPKLPTGEDLVMPGAIAADPSTNRVFVASMKRGEIFEVVEGGFKDYAGGLFQDCYGMLAEGGSLYVLHRRNLSRVTETGVERLFALPHGAVETYDYAYGPARDKDGRWVISYAPYANKKMPGSGSLIRLGPVEEVAWGFRNPVGWTSGPWGEVFYTDNQGEWVATNKLCAIVPGRYYGFPNPEQKEHASKPFGRSTVWVPYAWARSINGVAYAKPGTFGPFGGQIFLAELMFGGAILRADVERVNGEIQGVCFPFWGKGLLGPLTLSFDGRGRLWVGAITEPGWMAQPDRGAVFRIDATDALPFEMRTIRVRPRGFRVEFTRAVDPATVVAAAFDLQHHRYEYTGAYGSPELDKTKVAVEKVDVAADGLSAELTLPALVKDRVYMIGAKGVRSPAGEPLVHPVGAYTLLEIPR